MKKVLFAVCAASLMLCACERESTAPAPALNPANAPAAPAEAAPAAPAPADAPTSAALPTK